MAITRTNQRRLEGQGPRGPCEVLLIACGKIDFCIDTDRFPAGRYERSPRTRLRCEEIIPTRRRFVL